MITLREEVDVQTLSGANRLIGWKWRWM